MFLGPKWPLLAGAEWPTIRRDCAISVEGMLATGNTKITDLLCAPRSSRPAIHCAIPAPVEEGLKT